MDRLTAHPDLHVYHYGAYEPTALKQLVARHATREFELDELLHGKVFVDLYGITRQAARAGVESYGLKGVEALYRFERNPDVGSGLGSLGRWQDYLETHDRTRLDEIAVYNRDDCLSTRALDGWLRARRPDAEQKFEIVLDDLAPAPPHEPGDRKRALQARTEALRETLLAGLPDDESADTAEQRARRLMFALTGYHTREAKPAWWAYYDRRTKTPDELRDEDPEAIGGLQEISREQVNSSWQWTLSYPPQDHKIEPGRADDPIARTGVTVVSVDEEQRIVVVETVTEPRRRGPPRDRPGRAAGDREADRAPCSISPRTSPAVDSTCRASAAISCSAAPRGSSPEHPHCSPGNSTSTASAPRSWGSITAPSWCRARRAPARRGPEHGSRSRSSMPASASVSWPPPTRRSTTCWRRSTTPPTRSAFTFAAGANSPATATRTRAPGSTAPQPPTKATGR